MKKEIELNETLKISDSIEVKVIPYGFITEKLIEEKVFQERDRTNLLKDLKITVLLSKLFSNEWIYNNFAFKGGTCLTRYYLDYYRFSKDIDLNYKDKTSRPLRKKLKTKFDQILNEVLSELNWTATHKSGNEENYVSYKVKTNDETIDLSISFNELYEYPFKKEIITVKGLEKLKQNPKVEDFKNLIGSHYIQIYDIKEILLEKYRCILSRYVNEDNRGRDLLDLYEMHEKHITFSKDSVNLIVEKTVHSYNMGFNRTPLEENLKDLKKLLKDLIYKTDLESELLTKPIDKNKLEKYVKNELFPILEEARIHIMSKLYD